MPQESEFLGIANAILDPLGWKASSCAIIQTLWAGYGQICRLQALPTDPNQDHDESQSLILKYVNPPQSKLKSGQDEGHLRKLISYQVEQFFYTSLVSSMPAEIGIAHCWGHVQNSDCMAMILTDLREEYSVVPAHRGELSEAQVHAALAWLANFHGFWWKRRDQFKMEDLRHPPLDEARLSQDGGVIGRDGVWLNGGYTYVLEALTAYLTSSCITLTYSSYLATRRTEYNALKRGQESTWATALCEPDLHTTQSIAELAATILSPSSCRLTAGYQTLIHGDVKSENLFSTPSHSRVAFFDFQYVGLGLGVCDLAKLFTCSVPIDMLTTKNTEDVTEMDAGERMLLENYRKNIQEVSGLIYAWDDLVMHWNTALVDWLRFQASWGFWGNTEWLEARVRHILKDERWLTWVLDATRESASTSS